MKLSDYNFLGVLITACAFGTSTVSAQDLSATAQLQTSASIDASVLTAFQKSNQIVIGSFKVGFVNYNKATAKSGGGFFSRDGESRVVLRSKLEGLSPEHMQSIVDNIYMDFTEQLKKQGYEVQDRSVLTSLPAFNAIGGSASPYTVEGVSVAPHATAVYFAPTGQNVLEFIGEANGAPGLAGFANIGKQISSGNASVGFQEIAEKNKLSIVNVHYIVNFIDAEGTGGYSQKVTTVSLNQGLTVMPGSSVKVIAGYDSTFSKNIGTLTLRSPIVSSEQFGEFVETTSSLEKAAGVFSMVTGALSGGNSTNSGEYAVNANPDTYQKIATELLQTSNANFTAKMGAAK